MIRKLLWIAACTACLSSVSGAAKPSKHQTLADTRVTQVVSQATPTHVLRAIIIAQEDQQHLYLERLRKPTTDGGKMAFESQRRVVFFAGKADASDEEPVARVENPVWKKGVLYVSVLRAARGKTKTYLCSVDGSGGKQFGLARCGTPAKP